MAPLIPSFFALKTPFPQGAAAVFVHPAGRGYGEAEDSGVRSGHDERALDSRSSPGKTPKICTVASIDFQNKKSLVFSAYITVSTFIFVFFFQRSLTIWSVIKQNQRFK